MKTFITVDVEFGTIKMVAESPNQVVLITEGDDDQLVLNGHLHPRAQVYRASGGKPGAVKLAQMAQDEELENVVALVDSDYQDFMDQTVSLPKNVVRSSYHDIFMDLVRGTPRIMQHAVDILGRSKARGGTALSSSDVIAEASFLATRIGLIRLTSEYFELGLKMKDFPVGALSSFDCELAEIVGLAVARSEARWTVEQVLAQVDALPYDAERHGPRLMGDHDFFKAFRMALTRRGVQVSDEMLLSVIYASIGCESLARTSWHRTITDWSVAVSRYTFACPCGPAQHHGVG